MSSRTRSEACEPSATPPPSSRAKGIDLDAVFEVFLDEAAEGLATGEEALLTLETNPQDRAALDQVFRVVHNIKGDAATLGITTLAEHAHHVEDWLDRARRGELAIDPLLITRLLRGLDGLRDSLADVSDGGKRSRPDLDELFARLAAGLERDGGGSADAGPVPADGSRETTLRVEIDKLDRVVTLASEIAIARGRLGQLLEEPATPRALLLDEHRESDRLYLEIQELITKLRMVPVGPAFNRFRRLVRDLAKDQEKQVAFGVVGGEVEVDNSVLQHLKAPLTHMIRNALDHGIETPEVRRENGKSPSGRITLSAAHDSGSIVVELADDGAGLDRDRIVERARASGLLAEGESPSERELGELIFAPGFSTAREVTDLSGRGVGMDVVRRNIEALRGTVEVSSRAGRGTRIRLRLPLTLAIIEGLLIRVAEERYILPLDSVIETVELPPEARTGEGGSGIARVRGRTLPYVRLRHLLHLSGPRPERENVVVVPYGEREVGLVVDTVVGKSQTLIKPLAKLFRRLPGISGSAILSDGRVAFVLDLVSLLRLCGPPSREPLDATVATG